MLAVALGVALGVVQIGWMKLRRQPIDTMQWLSIGLVVVSGIATMLTSDPRFVMLKPQRHLLHRRRLHAAAGLDEPLPAADRACRRCPTSPGSSATCGPA